MGCFLVLDYGKMYICEMIDGDILFKRKVVVQKCGFCSRVVLDKYSSKFNKIFCFFS